jgi:hypothetical protein
MNSKCPKQSSTAFYELRERQGKTYWIAMLPSVCMSL